MSIVRFVRYGTGVFHQDLLIQAVSMRRSIRIQFMTVCWITLVAGLWVHDTLASQPISAGDFGQWIMFSRYYLGQTTPAYLDPRSVHPLIPIVLALTTKAFGNSVSAIVMVSGILYSLLVLTGALAAKTLFGDSVIAVMSAVVIAFGQPILLYMTLGLLPQLGALIGMNLAIIALVRIGRDSSQRWPWVLLAVSACAVPFSHLPSAPLYFVAVIGSLAYIGSLQSAHGLKLLSRSVLALFLPIFSWTIYCALFFGVVREYAINVAGYHRLGIDALARLFALNGWMTWYLFAGCLSLVLLGVLAIRSQNSHLRLPVGLLIIWLTVPLAFMVGSYLLHVGTDYGRFGYYFVVIPVFAATYILKHLVNRFWQECHSSRVPLVVPFFRIRRVVLGVCAFALIAALGLGCWTTIGTYPNIVSDLALRYSSSLLGAIEWLRQRPDERTIYAPSRPEGTWIEGLSGRATLYPEEFFFIYRPGLMDRSLAANLIGTGTSYALDNGLVLVRLQQTATGLSFNPSIAIYNMGEYANLFTMQDRLVTISINRDGKPHMLNLAEDFDQEAAILSGLGDGSLNITTTYHSRRPFLISVKKTVTVAQDSPDVVLHLELSCENAILLDEIRVWFADVVESTSEDVIKRTHVTNIYHRATATVIVRTDAMNSQMQTLVSFDPFASLSMPEYELDGRAKPYLQAEYRLGGIREARISITLEPETQGRYRSGLRANSLMNLLNAYDVGYIMVAQTDFRAQAVYDNLRFRRAFVNWNYVIYEVPSN